MMNFKRTVCLVVFGTIMGLTTEIMANDSVMSDGNIIISDGLIRCKDLICQRNAFKCRVEKKTINNNSEIETLMQCFDSNGNVLNERRSAERNPDPSQGMHSVSEANSNGYFTPNDSNSVMTNNNILLSLGGVLYLLCRSFHTI